MDFVPRTVINGSYVRRFINKPISIILKVDGDDRSSLKSTDGQEIRVKLPNNEVLDARNGDWVEIIGTPQSNNLINANEAIVFSEKLEQEFDADSYNMLVNFLNNAKDIYQYS